MHNISETHPIAHDVAAHYLQTLQARVDGTAPPLVDSGFNALDAALPGWLNGGQLITVASRPNVDRLGFAQAVAENIAAQHRTVLWFSLGAAKDDVIERSIARRSDVPVDRLRGGANTLDQGQRIRVLDAINQFSHLPILIDDARQNITSIGDKARHLHHRARTNPHLSLDCIVVDSLQLLPEVCDRTPIATPPPGACGCSPAIRVCR